MSAARRLLPFGIVVIAFIVAACGSSTSTSTAPSTISRCGVTLRASSTSVPAEGGAGQIGVTTARECAWSASSEASWLTINGPSSGQGDGSVQYRATQNADPVSRRTAIVLNDQRAEITQAAGTCVIRLDDPSAEFSPDGGNGTVQVDASSPMCTWTAAADVSWITLTSSTNGKGTASVNFAVAPTSGPPRTGTIRIADQQFSVTQSQGCAYTIQPTRGSMGAAGGTGSIAVTTAPGCPWNGLSNVPWISVTAGASGGGPGTVTFAVAPLEGPSRTGMLVIAGQTFTLEQSGGCSYRVEPLAHSVGAGGGTLSVTVQSAAGCDWSASSAVPWISISGASSGSGSGTVSFVAAASAGEARSGTLTVAGQTVTVNQAQGCSYAIQPESQSVPAAGVSGTVDVTAGSGCAWTAVSNVDWITVTEGGNGSGNGTVRFAVAATTGPARAGTVTIAGRTFTVNQGQSCAATLAPPGATVPASGGERTFEVTATAGCSWTASAAVPWITVAAGASGSGNGAVRIEIAANPGAQRTGTVIAAGQTFTVEQESGCALTLSASGQSVPAAGGNGKVDVSAEAGCTWAAASEQPWITISEGASGSGGGSVAFTVIANSGPERTGTIAIGGQAFTITQAGACAFAIAPQEQAAPASGGNVSVTVTAPGGCAWTAVSNAPWIAITDGASGSGNGAVQLSVQTHAGVARLGTATIAGQTFTVHQGSGCTYGLSPESRSADEDGERGSFDVKTSSSDCPWTATSTVPWITIEEEGGTGPGRVNYVVQANRTGERRTGTIAVEGLVFTVNQAR